MTKDSALNRALRVVSYFALTALAAGLVDMNAMQAIQNQYPALVPVFVFLPAVAAFIRGVADKDVKNF